MTISVRLASKCLKVWPTRSQLGMVVAMSVILSKTGGTVNGVEAVRKSYPSFFEDIKNLGAEVELL
mgnify:CR=1 FL=1